MLVEHHAEVFVCQVTYAAKWFVRLSALEQQVPLMSFLGEEVENSFTVVEDFGIARSQII